MGRRRMHRFACAELLVLSPMGKLLRIEFDLVFLDHRIGEELFAHLFYDRARLRFVPLCEFDVDDLALAHFADIAEAETVQSVADRLALGIEHAVLQRDENARLHAANIVRFVWMVPAQSEWLACGFFANGPILTN